MAHGKDNDGTLADDDITPMLPEQFETAVNSTKIQSADLINAARMVLCPVGGVKISVAEASAVHGVQEHYLRRAIKSIEKSWAKICTERGWEVNTAALSPELWLVLKTIQLQALKESADLPGRGRRRKK